MDRRSFIGSAAAGIAGAAVLSTPAGLLTSCATGTSRKSSPELKLSFQEGTAPGESLNEKFDYMEKLGIVGFEPHGKQLLKRAEEFRQALSGRNIKVSAICAGFDGFILAEDPAVKASFDSSMRELIAAAGEIGSTGVIMVPAFNGQKPCMSHTMETRDYLCEQLHELGEYALKHNTTVILEPLNRREAFYLRLVSDAAAICRDADSEGVRCMGDFWHMQEETSDYAAFISAGKYLQHVHVASRGQRRMPGEDGQLDNYIDGMRALKELDYQNYISFECGTDADREIVVPAAVELLRSQWEQA
ncbi:MAG: sugar phosphate isomerase/epimerase [Candidatus Cryptobacteroides sp.]|nr:sugar phosphate isomerase/epimerase [Candidatus Cryptobacteroides sp.]